MMMNNAKSCRAFVAVLGLSMLGTQIGRAQNTTEGMPKLVRIKPRETGKMFLERE